jgi:hypothetical protein
LKARLDRAVRTVREVCQVPEEEFRNFFTTLTQAETRANQGLIDEGLFLETEFDFLRFLGEAPYSLNS